MLLILIVYSFFIFVLAVVPDRQSDITKTLKSRPPQQIRLSLCDKPNCMVVTWSTMKPNGNHIVEYGTNETHLITIDACTRIFNDEYRNYYIHTVQLTQLMPNTTYVYRCTSFDLKSKFYKFKTFPEHYNWTPTVTVFGDLGFTNGRAIPQLISSVENKQLDVIFHIGDIAYNMEIENGTVGDKFLQIIEPISASVPYMVCAGNHEEYENFTHYKGRFRMPGPSEGLYYSLNIGPIHFVVYSTEIYYSNYYTEHSIRQQYEWMEADLQQAELNRHEQPWIITLAHRPMYCTSKVGDCNRSVFRIRGGIQPNNQYSLERLLYKYNVDMGVWGHEHVYERFVPMYRNRMRSTKDKVLSIYNEPKTTVHVVVGLPGSVHGPDKEIKAPKYSVFRSLSYGYGQVKAFNTSHLLFQYHSIKDQWNFKGESNVIDEFWIIKKKHKFNHKQLNTTLTQE